jgi:hypothetical protein
MRRKIIWATSGVSVWLFDWLHGPFSTKEVPILSLYYCYAGTTGWSPRCSIRLSLPSHSRSFSIEPPRREDFVGTKSVQNDPSKATNLSLCKPHRQREYQRCPGGPGPPVAPLGRLDYRTRLLSNRMPPAPTVLYLLFCPSIIRGIINVKYLDFGFYLLFVSICRGVLLRSTYLHVWSIYRTDRVKWYGRRRTQTMFFCVQD